MSNPKQSGVPAAYWLRKLHSLSGVVPIGGFLLVHLFSNHAATHGEDAFNAKVTQINELPFVLALEVFGIWLPILFHGILGMVIVFEGRSNAVKYPYGRNWMYALQRVTGVLALVFIAFHVFNFRFVPREEFLPEYGVSPYQVVQDQLTVAWWVLPFYVVGLVAAVFHFANGLAGFLFSWGFVVGDRAKRYAGMACAGFGAALLALGLDALIAFLP